MVLGADLAGLKLDPMNGRRSKGFMGIAFAGIRKGLSILKDDIILLIFVNILCSISILPALLFYNLMIANASVVTSIINTILFLPLVFFLFAL